MTQLALCRLTRTPRPVFPTRASPPCPLSKPWSGDTGSRTPDLLHAMQTRYQLRHAPRRVLRRASPARFPRTCHPSQCAGRSLAGRVRREPLPRPCGWSREDEMVDPSQGPADPAASHWRKDERAGPPRIIGSACRRSGQRVFFNHHLESVLSSLSIISHQATGVNDQGASWRN